MTARVGLLPEGVIGQGLMVPRKASDVSAVVSTYRPDAGFPDRVKRIQGQVGLTVIVDDGGLGGRAALLQSWFGATPDLILHHNPANVGLAASLNVGVSIARQAGYQWILTLDDDSVLDDGSVARLVRNVTDATDAQPIGIAALSWRSPGEVMPPAPRRHPAQWERKRAVITSGSLFSLRTFDAVGPFREDYVIDGLDYEYCLRARGLGLNVIRFSEIGFTQNLGSPTTHRLGPITIRTFNYSAPRYYYRYRNNVRNLLLYGGRDPVYAGAVIWDLIRSGIRMVTFEQRAGLKTRQMLRGVWHGVIGRMGMMPPRPAE
jgi:rhamnosyltransferase